MRPLATIKYKLKIFIEMEKKDFNEVFDMMHKEVMDKARELFTELFKRAMLVRAMSTKVAPPEVETWEQLKDWVMLSDFQDIAEVTRYLIAMIDSVDDYRELPEPFEEIFTKQEDERLISEEVLSVFTENAQLYNEVEGEKLSVDGFESMDDFDKWVATSPSEVLNLVRFMAFWQ